MATTLTALTTGVGGLSTLPDNSGAFEFKKDLTSLATLGATGNFAATGTITGTTVTASSSFSGSGSGITGVLKLGTAVTTLSGASIDFINIPSWVKRITVMLQSVTCSAGDVGVRLGTAGGIVATGYSVGGGEFQNGNLTSVGGSLNDSSFSRVQGITSVTGFWTLINFNGNVWSASWTFSDLGTKSGTGSGFVTLTGALTTVRIVAGTGTFSAGAVNILYE